MAKREKKINLLCEEFQKLRSEKIAEAEKSDSKEAEHQSGDSSSSDSDDLRHLRSGSRHPRVPPPSSIVSTPSLVNPSSMSENNPAPGSSGVSTIPASHHTNPIKVLPTVAEVRAFSGTDSEYSAREYIAQCEDVMANSYVTDSADKISFLQSRLQLGSRAAQLMHASAFTEPLENKDYELFKTNFLEAFASNLRHSLVKGVSNAMQTFLENAASLDNLEAQVEANQISVDFTHYLRNNGWVNGDNISLKNHQRFMEFIFYIGLLKEKYRRNTLSLEYKPTERLHEFSMRLKTKIEEKGGEDRMTASSAAAAAQTVRQLHTLR